MTSPKVILVEIVRDESAIIRERLEAVRDRVDAWCIIDTGSVDDTPDIIYDVMDGKPGFLGVHPWNGFADARSHAVDRATKWVTTSSWAIEQEADWYALLLDADTVAHFEPTWRQCLFGDVVEATVHHDSLRYNHPRLLRLNGHAWRWRSQIHEYLEVPPSMGASHTSVLWVEHGHGGARELKGAAKFKDDAELIERLRAENAEPDLDSRYCFYLAQSLRDCGEIDRAIETYMERTRLGGWHEEVSVSHLRAGELLWQRNNWPGTYACWTAAWATDPSRAEPLIGLASLCRVRSFWTPAYEFGRMGQRAAELGPHGLFADINVSWRADYEVAVAGSWVATPQSKAAGRKACLELLKSPLVNENIKAIMRNSLTEFYLVPKRAPGRATKGKK